MNEDLLNDLAGLTDWQDRYQTIIEAGEALPSFPTDKMTDDHRVYGCMSNVWLVVEKKDGRYFFQGTSDGIIVKGLIAVALSVANGKSKEELAGLDFEKIFAKIGLSDNLSQSRRNGFASLIKKIKSLGLE